MYVLCLQVPLKLTFLPPRKHLNVKTFWAKRYSENYSPHVHLEYTQTILDKVSGKETLQIWFWARDVRETGIQVMLKVMYDLFA